ncbi:DgyrCDS2575 [Dimorphilus gyrociliatus]|uniref:DgyrCDS2575 n=1 Tax=Dimorphilus gyrociliatus TaxID=2664684 RepID=A0A7I8VB44_9ANNE|nr:DgyrCDS2575 [Dimorphilus gyrociliatus]
MTEPLDYTSSINYPMANGYDYGYDEKDGEYYDETDDKDLPPVPKTMEDFLRMENLEEWPQKLTSENPLDILTDKNCLGSKTDLQENIEDSTPDIENVFDVLQERVNGLSKTILYFGEKMFNYQFPSIEESKEKNLYEKEEFDSQEESYKDAFLTELSDSQIMDANKYSNRSKTLEDSMKESQKGNVKYCTFPGFKEGDLTSLPSNVEAPHVLHHVSKANEVNTGLRKFWKKIFQSEASIALLQDSVWWLFIHFFEPTRISERDKLFDRMSDSFVTLLLSIHPDLADKVFMIYPSCLAQSVFVSFQEAFPESGQMFDNSFKEDICGFVYEWITGTKPPVGSWKVWNFNRLKLPSEHRATSDEGELERLTMDIALNNRPLDVHLGFDEFLKVVENLGDKELEDSQNTTLVRNKSKINIMRPSNRRKKVDKSHVIGRGSKVEKVLFDLKGRSPLVEHFLNMKLLAEKEPPRVPRRMQRIQIIEEPENKMTYKQVINETVEKSRINKEKFMNISKETEKELAKLEKERKMMKRKIEKLQKDLLFIKDPAEARKKSEKVFSSFKQSYDDLIVMEEEKVENLEDEEDKEENFDD